MTDDDEHYTWRFEDHRIMESKRMVKDSTSQMSEERNLLNRNVYYKQPKTISRSTSPNMTAVLKTRTNSSLPQAQQPFRRCQDIISLAQTWINCCVIIIDRQLDQQIARKVIYKDKKKWPRTWAMENIGINRVAVRCLPIK